MTAIKERIKLAAPGSPRMYVTEGAVRHINTSKEQTKEVAAAPSRSDEATVKVRINFPTLGEEWIMSPSTIYVYKEEGFYEQFRIKTYDEEGNQLFPDYTEIEIPAGAYDFMAVFCKRNPDKLFQEDRPMVYDILENVSVSEGSEVTLNPEECTVRLSMQTYNPDGEKTRFRTNRYNEDGTFEILEESNVSSGILEKMIFLKNEMIFNIFFKYMTKI